MYQIASCDYIAENTIDPKANALCLRLFRLLKLHKAYLLSQVWFATVHEVLQADWHEVWHSPQPPLAIVFFKTAVFKVLICFIVCPPSFYMQGL